jgi:hypothetical protein
VFATAISHQLECTKYLFSNVKKLNRGGDESGFRYQTRPGETKYIVEYRFAYR